MLRLSTIFLIIFVWSAVVLPLEPCVAADEDVDPGGKSFDLSIGAVGVHEHVTLAENRFGKIVPMANVTLRGSGRSEAEPCGRPPPTGASHPLSLPYPSTET